MGELYAGDSAAAGHLSDADFVGASSPFRGAKFNANSARFENYDGTCEGVSGDRQAAFADAAGV
jgi:hypothetical protein